jgi:hypothetical protein
LNTFLSTQRLMKKYIALPLFSLSLLATLAGYAQAPLNDRDLRDVANDRSFSALNLNRATAASQAAAMAEAAHPNHYFDPAWRAGTIMGPSGLPMATTGMRYNLVHYWLEVQDPAVPGGLRVMPVGSFRGFVLAAAGSDPERRFGTYRGPGTDGRLVLEELTNTGPVHLLMRHEVEYLPAVQNVALHLETQPAREQRFISLYASGPTGPSAHQQALTEKAALKLFGKDAPVLARYATDHQLRVSELPDLVRLVDYYNATYAQAAPAAGPH